MKSCLLIRTELGKHTDVVKDIGGMKGVNLVFSVLGRADVVANVDVDDLKALTDLILRIVDVDGFVNSETLIDMEV